ncbi:unnamed protein product [Symbiodinium pilosum]|uniref:ASCH domain-containing protein n=1 Tax=Symbiodinium pilosum TaxID=2952 RepID=A0A812QR08_SYMPI|nr:unnamed protein product [Symbiodinium pilosum]
MAPKVQSPNAAVAFGTTAYALKIRPYWLAKILQGEKRVEIRGGRCPHPERITLMETGSLLLRARATITQSHLMTDSELLENQEAVSDLDYKEYWAWTLTEVEVLDPPILVPSMVARGSVTWMLRTRWEAWDAGHLGLQPKISDFFGRDSSAASSSRTRSRSRAAANPDAAADN